MPDRELAIEALRLAHSSASQPEVILERARAYYRFLTGSDVAALIEEAKAAIDRVGR